MATDREQQSSVISYELGMHGWLRDDENIVNTVLEYGHKYSACATDQKPKRVFIER